MTAATSLNTSWGLEKSENIVLVGGSDYSTSSYFLQEVTFKDNTFKVNMDG